MSNIPRVIAGKIRGLRIESPKGDGTRPTTDRVKESLFNIIMQLIPNANVLDLFAGSGSLGIEALSRGALKGVFVEIDSNAAKIIKKNIEFCKLGSVARVIGGSYIKVLPRLSTQKEQFEIIFADPPYGTGVLQSAVDEIFRLDLLSKDGIIIAEHPVNEECTSNIEANIIRTKIYGDTAISIVKRKD